MKRHGRAIARSRRLRRFRPSAAETHRRGKAVVCAVLDAALAELAAVGFPSLSVERVAARAGVNKTTVYRRYATKEELVHAALSHKIAPREAANSGNLRDDLVHLVLSTARYMTEPLGRSVLSTLLAEHPSSELSRLVGRMRRAGEREPLTLFRRAIARGELPAETSLRVLLDAFYGPIVHRVFLGRGAFDRADAVELVDIVLDGARRRRTRDAGSRR